MCDANNIRGSLFKTGVRSLWGTKVFRGGLGLDEGERDRIEQHKREREAA